MHRFGQQAMVRPTYSIELTIDDLHSGIPHEVQEDLRSIDITKAVVSGEVTVGNLR